MRCLIKRRIHALISVLFFLVFNSNASGVTESQNITYSFYISIGSQIWFDANHNGIKDIGEKGLPGV